MSTQPVPDTEICPTASSLTPVHQRWIKSADVSLFPDHVRAPSDRPRGIGVMLNYSSADVEALARRARQHNARIVAGPVNRPWNICELLLLDPDGYRLVFNGPRTHVQHRSFDDIVAGVAQGFLG